MPYTSRSSSAPSNSNGTDWFFALCMKPHAAPPATVSRAASAPAVPTLSSSLTTTGLPKRCACRTASGMRSRGVVLRWIRMKSAASPIASGIVPSPMPLVLTSRPGAAAFACRISSTCPAVLRSQSPSVQWRKPA